MGELLAVADDTTQFTVYVIPEASLFKTNVFVVAPEIVVITPSLVSVPSVTSDPSNCH